MDLFCRLQFVITNSSHLNQPISAALPTDLTIGFTITPPEYMWYDTSDGSSLPDPFFIDCDGFPSDGAAAIAEGIYMNDKLLENIQGGTSSKFDFGSRFTSDKSGVYQCGLYNTKSKQVWVQKTTSVMIASQCLLVDILINMDIG